jgi:hypothetical protein
VTLLKSALVEVPTVLGWLQPVILLPAAALTGLNPDQLKAILAHELAHIRRWDYLANIAQTVVEILGFYHPAVWWVSSRIRIERENCCDDLAVQVCGNSLQYAKALTSMEEIRHNRTDLAMAASGGSLMARIARLLGRPTVDDRRFAWLPGLIALLLVVGVVIPAALVLGAPHTPLATPHVDLETTEGHAPNADATTVIERSPQDHVADSNETQVLTNWVIAKVRTETVLDRETLRRIGEILAGERPQIARELAATGQKTTLGQVLKTYVARQSLSQEVGQALIDLLKTLELTTRQARPSMTAADGRQFQLRTISEEWFFSPHRVRPAQAGEEPNLIRIEYGTIITGTARTENDASVTLDMVVSSSEPEPRADPNDLPVVHRMATSTTVNVPGNRYFSLLVESRNREARQAEEAESLLVMVKPRVARSASRPNDFPAAPTRQDESRPRHVLLDARVVEIEPARLTELGVEWSFPPGQTGKPDDDWTKGLQIGYLPDSAFTNSFLAALNLLDAVNQAKVVSNPQIVAMEGCRARLRSSQEQWILMDGPSASTLHQEIQNIGSGRILDVTCRIGDNNDITLDVAIEISNSVPGRLGSGSDLPIITRRMARNSVTVMNGGTVALAGQISRQSSQTTKETAIFVTATRIPDIREVTAAPSGSELSDLVVRALSAEIAKAEQSLVVLRQTHVEANPEVVQQKTLLKALKDRLEDRRTELKREHESDLREESDARTWASAGSRQTGTAETSNAVPSVDLFSELVEISRRFGVKVAVDLSVKTQLVTANLTDATAEAAIRQILKGTPYTFRVASEADRQTFIVYRPITAEFQGGDLIQALDTIAEMANVPIIPGPDVQGKIAARMNDLDVETALRLVLAGTPYVFKKISSYYLVARRDDPYGPAAIGDETKTK